MRRPMRPLVVGALALTLALTASAPAGAISREGTWKGPTSQGYTMRFRVNATEKITFLTFKVDVSGFMCEGTMTWSASGRWSIRPDGSFVIRGQDDLDSFVVRGDFVARNRAKGTLRTSVIEGCVASGSATWVANRVL